MWGATPRSKHPAEQMEVARYLTSGRSDTHWSWTRCEGRPRLIPGFDCRLGWTIRPSTVVSIIKARAWSRLNQLQVALIPTPSVLAHF